MNMQISRCYAQQRKQIPFGTQEDEQLASKVLLCVGQQVILISNLWVEAGLINGSLGKVVAISYVSGSRLPELPSFVVVDFIHYKGPPWDISHPNYVPMSLGTRGSRT